MGQKLSQQVGQVLVSVPRLIAKPLFECPYKSFGNAIGLRAVSSRQDVAKFLGSGQVLKNFGCEMNPPGLKSKPAIQAAANLVKRSQPSGRSPLSQPQTKASPGIVGYNCQQ